MGVAVRYDDHTRDTWQVGDRKAAEAEVARLRGLAVSGYSGPRDGQATA
jgi:hypothetical protein